MPEVNSPASASPSMLAGLNPSANSGSPDESNSAGRIPGSQSESSGASGSGADGQNAGPGAKMNKDIQALRSMEAALMEMVQSYPTATKAIRTASEAIRSAQRQIVSNPGQAEPPVPNTLG